jgi:hypothetical protein
VHQFSLAVVEFFGDPFSVFFRDEMPLADLLEDLLELLIDLLIGQVLYWIEALLFVIVDS